MKKFHEEILLDEEIADSLVIDLKRYGNKNRLSAIHGRRFALPNTSDDFKYLNLNPGEKSIVSYLQMSF